MLSTLLIEAKSRDKWLPNNLESFTSDRSIYSLRFRRDDDFFSFFLFFLMHEQMDPALYRE